MDYENWRDFFIKTVGITGIVAITAFASIEGYDIATTINNTDEISQNEADIKKNRESLTQIMQKIAILEPERTEDFKFPRMCICVAEEDSKQPRRKICQISCTTSETVRKCELIHPGYHCGQ